MKTRWLISSACGFGLLAGSATAALAQNVPSENATAPAGNGAATQTVTLKPGQEAGTSTVLPEDTAGNPNASAQDARFVWKASAGGKTEVMMGHLAIMKGQTQGERDFGQMLVTDHTRADDRLMGIAQTMMLKVAPGPNAMQRAMYQQLSSAPADQFDTMFNHAMIRAHERTIALFKMEAHQGQSPPLRQFAMMTLPVLYKHLHVAEQLSPMANQSMSSMNTMGGTGGMSSGGMSSASAMAGGRMMSSNAALSAPVSGNPDNSADQLNARELSSTGTGQ